jgi:hypothetical protein
LPGDRAATTTVVEQCVDGFLQHPLLVVDDDLGGTEVEQTLEAVVAVDHAAVQVVEVGRRETSAVELHHRAQFRRDHRDHVEDHRLGVVGPGAALVTLVERGHDLQTLDRLLATLRTERLAATLWRIDCLAEAGLFDIEVDPVDQRLDAVCSGAAFEVVAVTVAQLSPQHLVVDDLAAVDVLELVPCTGQEVEFGLVAIA